MYTRNYVQEGGGIQLGRPTRRRCRNEMDRRRRHRDSPGRAFPEVDPLTVRFTDLRDKVMHLDGFDDDPKSSNEPKLEAIQMAWYEEWKENQ
jgi:FeS assembly protein IscX